MGTICAAIIFLIVVVCAFFGGMIFCLLGIRAKIDEIDMRYYEDTKGKWNAFYMWLYK